MVKKIALLCSMSMVVSCATMFNENNRKVEVIANPPATVYYDGHNYGPTPATVNISGYKILGGPKISVEKKGYYSQTKEVPTRFQGWSIVSVILGVVPVFVDIGTGNVLALDSHIMRFDLEEMPK